MAKRRQGAFVQRCTNVLACGSMEGWVAVCAERGRLMQLVSVKVRALEKARREAAEHLASDAQRGAQGIAEAYKDLVEALGPLAWRKKGSSAPAGSPKRFL